MSADNGADDGGLTWLILAAGVLYAAFFLAHLHEILTVTYQNSDVDIVAVVAHMLDSGAPVGTVVIGNRPLYEEILGLTVTGWLPAHREIWLLAPLAWGVVGLGVLGWSAAQAFGRRAGAITIVAVACLGQMGRQYFLSWNFHDLPQFHAIVLMAALIYASRFATPLAQRRVVLGALVLGVIGAFPFASDALFCFSGLAPLLGASLALVIVRPTRGTAQLLGLSVGVCLLSVVLGEVLTQIMVAHGLTHSAIPLQLTPFALLGHDAYLMLQGLTNIAGGDFFGIAPDGHGVLTVIRGCLVLGGLAGALLCVLGSAVRVLRRDRTVATPRLLYTCFWALALVLGLGVFLFSDVAVDYLSGRYLLAPYIAIPALVVGAVSAWPRVRGRLIAAAVGVFALCGALQLPGTAAALPGLAPGPPAAWLLGRYAAREHVSVGYASYWAAVALTWETHFSVQLGAVQPCPVGSATGLCPAPVSVSGWYTPKPHIRSMLIVDPTVPSTGGISPPASGWMTGLVATDLGTPIAHAAIDGMEVYVYGYDIASRFGA